MNSGESVTLARAVDATVVPSGTRVTLQKGEAAQITQSLGGSYTVIVNGNMFRIEGKNADALGFEISARPEKTSRPPRAKEAVEQDVWSQLKTCYDPEIPVNVVDLGLIYDCALEPMGSSGTYRSKIKMTLTAPGCGMGPMLAQDVQNKLLSIDEIEDASVEVVWDPPWNQAMLSEEAKLQLGLM